LKSLKPISEPRKKKQSSGLKTEQKERKESGFYYRFFNESDTAMAIINRDGLIITANKKFGNLLESLCQSGRNAVHGSGRSRLPALIQEIPDPLHAPAFWSSLMPLVSGEKNYIVFECTFNHPRSGVGDGIGGSDIDDIPHW